MNLVINQDAIRHELDVDRVAAPHILLLRQVYLYGNPDVRGRTLSGRTFVKSQFVTAELIRFITKQPIITSELNSSAEVLKWFVADIQEFVSFLLTIPMGFADYMPAQLIASIHVPQRGEPGKITCLRLTKKGMGNGAKFSLDEMPINDIRGQIHVLLAREHVPMK